MKHKLKWLVYPYGLWILLTIITPIILILYYSLTTKSGSFTLMNFQTVFTWQYISNFGRSLLVAAFTTILCLVIGFPTALFITHFTRKQQQIVLFLFILPTWTNIVLRTYAWLTMFYKGSIIDNIFNILGIHVQLQYSTFAVYLGMIYNFLPFMILPLYTAIAAIDKAQLEASEDLGASKRRQLFDIIIPIATPGIISGIIMVFLPAATTFVIPQILSGGKYNLIGNVIERQFFSANNMNFGSALSIILILLIIVSIFVMETINNAKKNKEKKQRSESEVLPHATK